MDKEIVENLDISDFERQLDQNWNERKHLAEAEFDLRTVILELLQQDIADGKFQEARQRESENRASLARNNQEFDTLIEGWAAATVKS